MIEGIVLNIVWSLFSLVYKSGKISAAFSHSHFIVLPDATPTITKFILIATKVVAYNNVSC